MAAGVLAALEDEAGLEDVGVEADDALSPAALDDEAWLTAAVENPGAEVADALLLAVPLLAAELVGTAVLPLNVGPGVLVAFPGLLMDGRTSYTLPKICTFCNVVEFG